MGITGIHLNMHSYSNAYINRTGLACLIYTAHPGMGGFKLSFDELLPSVLACVEGRVVGAGATDREITRQALSSVAQCVAAMCLEASAEHRTSTINTFLVDAARGGDSGTDISHTVLYLLSIGEVGRRPELGR